MTVQRQLGFKLFSVKGIKIQLVLLWDVFQEVKSEEMVGNVSSAEGQSAITVSAFSSFQRYLTVLDHLVFAFHLTYNSNSFCRKWLFHNLLEKNRGTCNKQGYLPKAFDSANNILYEPLYLWVLYFMIFCFLISICEFRNFQGSPIEITVLE